MQCEICGKEFEPNPSAYKEQLYCSRPCNDKAKYRKFKGPLEIRSCAYCGKSFMQMHGTQKYCSAACRENYHKDKASIKGKSATIVRKQTTEPRACRQCGASFIPKIPQQVFCSRACSRRGERKHHRRGESYTCKYCGKTFIPRAPAFTTYCSRECFFAYRRANPKIPKPTIKRKCETVCVVCGHVFMGAKTAKCCSDECRKEHACREARDRAQRYHKEAHKTVTCRHCGNQFEPEYGFKRRVFCTDRCARRWYEKQHEIKKRGAWVESVDLFDIFRRDNGRCQICGRNLRLSKKVPDPRAPTIDHILPFAHGGKHERKNARLVCFECNWRKKDGTGPHGDQLLLIG